MAYLQEYEIDWNTFKIVHTTLSSATLYYLQNDLQYVPFVIEEGTSPIVAQAIYYVNVNRDPSSVSGPYAALTAGTKSSKHIEDITYTAVNYGAVAATGSATVDGYTSLSGATLTVNGIVLTEGVEWTAATSNNATATSLASAITTATATTHATGSATGAVVTITANTAGAAGNAISLASSDGTHLPVSGAFLVGGTNGVNGDSITIQYVDTSTAATGTVTIVDYTKLVGATLTVNGVVLTEGTQWHRGASNNAAATSLAGAVTTATATTLCTASALGAVITVTANDATFKSNFISLATSDPVNLTLSDSHLTGGEGGAGYEYVVVSGTAITVHITNGVSSAQQVAAAVVSWNAYSGIPQYNSAASAALVSAVIDAGLEGTPQTVQGPTALTGGAVAVTVLSDWETTYKSAATLVASFSNGVALEV